MRVLASYDFRDDVDEFTVRGIAKAVHDHSHYAEADWQQGISRHYERPQAPRMKVGDMITEARAVYRARTHADAVPQLPATARGRSPRPAWFDRNMEIARQVAADMRQAGQTITPEAHERECARRRRATASQNGGQE